MRHVTLIVGAPCSGKSTFAQQQSQPGDLIVDWDQLAVDAGSPFTHDHPAEFRAAATAERKRLERHITDTDDITAWVIRTLPIPTDREEAFTRIRATHLQIIDPGMNECLRRARDNGRPTEVDAVIVKWFALQAGARNYTTRTDRDRKGDPRRTADWKRVTAIIRKQTTACGICGQRIAWDQRAPHPKSFSVDHITPLSKGGAPYDLTNLRGVHLACNTARGNRPHHHEHRTSQPWR